MSIFYAESIKSIFRTLRHHLHNLGGQVEEGLEGVHHVDGEVVKTAMHMFQGQFFMLNPLKAFSEL